MKPFYSTKDCTKTKHIRTHQNMTSLILKGINLTKKKKALNEMQNQKSPGSDGLSIEFYKTFLNDIKSYYLESVNFSFQTGNLTDLQKQGVITLIPKANKDTSLLTNWRPISLLNVDYKIATKALANRIKKL